MTSPITPLGARIVAVREKPQQKTASGIYLPETPKEKPTTAEIVAIGTDVKNVKVGDKIVYKDYTATELKIDTVEYLVVNEEDILATIA